MKPKIILVCGGRDITNQQRQHVNNTLDKCVEWFDDDFVIVQGDATGTDWAAKNWAIKSGAINVSMNACWDCYGNNAGNIRNGWMLRIMKPDLVIAFEGGSGTADMKKQAKEAGVPVYEA